MEELQVLGGTCLFIASKLREASPLTVDGLVECGGYSYSIRDVRVSDQLITIFCFDRPCFDLVFECTLIECVQGVFYN